MKLSSNTRAVTLAAVAYTLITIAYSWPLAINLAHGVAHDLGDPILNAWIPWWTTKAVPLTAHWWNAPIFYPAVGTFAFSEHLLGLAPIAAPIIAVTGNPLLAYNVALLASYVLSGLGAYFLGYALTRRHDAAFVAGMAYAFAPYRLSQLPHIQVLSGYWAPVCLAALHRYDEEVRELVHRSFSEGGWALLAAGAWLMQALCNGYYLFFLSVLLVFWFAWFALGRWSARQLATVAAGFAVAAVLVAPLLFGYKDILIGTYGFTRALESIQSFSADAAGLLQASDDLLLWGWVHVIRRPEGDLFPGPTIIVLAILAVVAGRPLAAHAETTRARWWTRRILAAIFVALAIASVIPVVQGTWRLTIGGVRLLSIARADKPVTLAMFTALAWMATLPRMIDATRRRAILPFYAVAAFAMWVFALGPDPMIFQHRLLYQAPYGWLMRLPGFDGLRVPARFWMMALVCLSVLAALAINRLQGRTRRVVVSIAAAGLLLDGWPRVFTVLPAPDRRPTPPGVTARLDLPMTTDTDAAALFQQTFDAVPLYNGFSGYIAPHQYAMRELLDGFDARILTALTARGSLGVVIDHEADGDGKIRSYILAFPGAALQETHPRWSSYRLPAGAPGDLLPDRQGPPIPIKRVDSFPSPPHAPRAVDGNLRTRWSGGVQRAAADFTIELEQPAHVGQVVTDLAEFWTDFPQRLRVDISPDGSAWETVFFGDTMLQAYYAGVRHPKEMPLVFPINRDDVRFIRLQQMGWGRHDWSIAEIHVLK